MFLKSNLVGFESPISQYSFSLIFELVVFAVETYSMDVKMWERKTQVY